eukprot:71893_1
MGNESSAVSNGCIMTSFDVKTKMTKCTWTFEQNLLKPLNNIVNGQYIQSDYFETKEDWRWYVRCYPKGYSNKYNGHCQMFLYLSSIPNTYKSIKIYYHMKYIKYNST